MKALKTMPPRIDTPILFPAPRGGYIDIEKFRYREWSPALRAAGLPHHRLYDLRNMTATWMLDAGVPAPNVAEMLGTSVQQLEDTYNQPTVEALSRYAARLDSYGAAAVSS